MRRLITLIAVVGLLGQAWGAVTLTWDASADQRVVRHRVYVLESSFFQDGQWITAAEAIAQGARLQSTRSDTLMYSATQADTLWFRATALDDHGNESGFNVDEQGNDVEIMYVAPTDLQRPVRLRVVGVTITLEIEGQ